MKGGEGRDFLNFQKVIRMVIWADIFACLFNIMQLFGQLLVYIGFIWQAPTSS